MTTLNSFYKKYKYALRLGLVFTLFSLIALLFIYSGVLTPVAYRGVARLEIEGEGYKRAFEGEVVDNMTALEVIQASAAAGNISFKYDFQGDNLVVKSFNGFTLGNTSKSIIFYLNSSQVEAKKLHAISIKDGDVVFVKIK